MDNYCTLLISYPRIEEAETIERGLKRHGIPAEIQPCEGSFNVMINLGDATEARRLLSAIDFAAEEKL